MAEISKIRCNEYTRQEFYFLYDRTRVTGEIKETTETQNAQVTFTIPAKPGCVANSLSITYDNLITPDPRFTEGPWCDYVIKTGNNEVASGYNVKYDGIRLVNIPVNFSLDKEQILTIDIVPTIHWQEHTVEFDKYNARCHIGNFISNGYTYVPLVSIDYSPVQGTVIKPTAPGDYTKQSRTSNIVFRWDDPWIESGVVAHEILYLKKGNGEDWTPYYIEPIGEYVMAAGWLTEGEYQWYVEAEAITGEKSQSVVMNFTISNDIKIQTKSPSDGKSFYRNERIKFQWTNSLIGSGIKVYQQQIYFNWADSEGWEHLEQIDLRADDVEYSTTIAKLVQDLGLSGVVTWGIGAQERTYTGPWDYSNESTFEILTGDFTLDAFHPVDGDRISCSQPTLFSWSNSYVGKDISIKSQKFCWKYIEETEFREINVSVNDSTYEAPGGTFENNSTIQWYAKAIDEYEYSIESAVQTVYVGVIPAVIVSYPTNVNIKSAFRQVFTWEMLENVPTGQKSYELRYKNEHDDDFTVITEETNRQYHSFEPDTFESGNYVWEIKVTNNDGNSTDYISSGFTVIGMTDAPTIYEVTNAAMPVIKWEVPSQDTFEVEIYSADKKMYSSGIKVGYEVREFAPNIILNDGNYIAKMRVMNEYGYYTEWEEYGFVIQTTKPSDVECIAYANRFLGVDIKKGDGIAEDLYVVRRKYGEKTWEVIALIHENEVFSDNTVLPEVKYEYAIRNLQKDAGFTDSNVVSMVISYDGNIIYNGNDFVKLYKTESQQFEISHIPAKSCSYASVIGRKYPIRESSENMSHTTSITCFVTFAEYKMIAEFYENSNGLWFKNKDFSFKCAIDSITINETLLGKGYAITITLSRTNEDEVLLIE